MLNTTSFKAALALLLFCLPVASASAQTATACPADFDCFGFEGDPGGDRLCGTTATDPDLWGTLAAGRLCGRQGDDMMNGDQGNDLVNGNQGEDIVNGGRGNDVVRGGKGDDEVRGGMDDDEVYGDEGSDSLWGDLGNDTLYGGPEDDDYHYRLGDGDDVVEDTEGVNRLVLHQVPEEDVWIDQVDDSCFVSISSPEAYGSIEFRSQNCDRLETNLNNAPCVADSTTLCLTEGRFQAMVSWRDFDGNQGTGRVVLASEDSGLFWFFGANNWEMLVKVIDGCSLNQHFWVFAAATTNVEYTLTVTDSETGEVAQYQNSLGTSSAAITDNQALAVCP